MSAEFHAHVIEFELVVLNDMTTLFTQAIFGQFSLA